MVAFDYPVAGPDDHEGNPLMLRIIHDPLADARYVDDVDEHGPSYARVARTVSLTARTVNLDYDREGNLIGVEIL